MAAVLAPSLSIYWCKHMLSVFTLLCSAGIGQTMGLAVSKNLNLMVGVLSKRENTQSGFICVSVGKEWLVRLECA